MVLPCQLRGCVPLVRHSLVVQPRMVLPCLLRIHVPKAGQIPLHPDYPSWVPVNSCGLVSASADGRCVLMPWQKRERARACSLLCFDCSLLRRYPERFGRFGFLPCTSVHSRCYARRLSGSFMFAFLPSSFSRTSMSMPRRARVLLACQRACSRSASWSLTCVFLFLSPR